MHWQCDYVASPSAPLTEDGHKGGGGCDAQLLIEGLPIGVVADAGGQGRDDLSL